MRISKKVLTVVCLLLFVFGATLTAKEFKPWLKVKASYQTVFSTDMADELGFDITRARLGAAGQLFNNVYFEVVFEGKYTQSGKGTELKKAFFSWSFSKNHRLIVGAMQTAFTRPISGTEFAFINYSLLQSPDSYQYGIGLEGSLMNGMLAYYLSASNGEGMRTSNVGKGLLYMGRVEWQAMGKKDLVEGCPVLHATPSFTLSAAAALDNKSQTDDFGVTYQYYNSLHFVADATFKMGALSLFMQGNYNKFDQKEDGTYWGGLEGTAKKTLGGLAQVGYNLINVTGHAIEPIVKYEYWREVLNDGYGDENVDKTLFAVGVNWYLKGHYLKVNAEYRHVMNDDRFYSVKKPSDDYFGIRLTHKFASGKIGL